MSQCQDRSLLPLYLSRALAAWGDRTWQFMGGLFMLQLDGSLQLVAVYGLVSCLALLLLGNALGRLVDTRPRDHMIKSAVLTQNISVSVTCLVLALHFSDALVSISTYWISGTALLLYTVSYLASVAARISVEKDWVVCLCEDDTSRLATVNTNVRSIDLFCNLLAPTLAGIVIESFSYFTAAVILIFWVLVSATLELLLLLHVFKTNTNLHNKQVGCEEGEEEGGYPWFYENFSGWKTYFNHPVREAGLGMAMLYMTVLGFDSITWGYCYHQGVSEGVLGGLTAVSALVGVTGARLFPLLARRVGLTSAGLLGFTLQSCFLALCVASVWAPGSPFSLTSPDSQEHLESSNHDQIIPSHHGHQHLPIVSPTSTSWRQGDNVANITSITKTISSSEQSNYVSVTLLLIGIISSRFGLWIADLSVHQIFQEEIGEQQRGAVCGVQAGLQSLMDLLKFLLVLFIPHQNTFGILIILSYLFVTAGGLFFFKYKLKSVASNGGETDKLIG